MSIERPNNERLKLYERFRQSLVEGNDAEFFDADDLIIIIDQAVDLEDEYVQIEAIMRGYRFFPDNEELANRRAFLYYDLHLDRGVENMVTHRSDSSPMWDILKLRLTEDVSPENAEAALNQILATPGKFDDETVIQLVDCASASGCYRWLKDHEAELRAKTEYLPSLLYELFIVADTVPDNEYSVSLLEELTELEPFNADFWFALAQEQSNLERLDDALTSIDYALAIDSENLGVLTLKASVYIRQDKYQEALHILEQLHTTAPDHIVDELRIRAMYGLGQNAQIFFAINEAAEAYPAERIFFEFALFIEHPEIQRLMQTHFDASSDDDRNKWMDWGVDHYVAGHFNAAVQIFYTLFLNQHIPYRGFKYLASALFCAEQYEACIALLDTALENHDLMIPDIVVAGLLSLVKQGKKRNLKSAFKKVMAQFPMSIKEPWALSSTLENLGFTSFLGILQQNLDAGQMPDFDELNIFHFPQSYNSNEK